MSTPDPAGPEASAADVVEQDAVGASAVPEVDVPLEAVDADVVEQATDAGPGERVVARDTPLEADAADAAEQSTEVELDEDERR